MATHTHRNDQYRRQLRGFIAVWVSVTLLIGVATFVGIYIGTGRLDAATASESNTTTNLTANNEQALQPPAEADTITDTQTDDVPLVESENESIVDEGASEPVQQSEPAADPMPVAQEATPTPIPQPTIPPRQNREFDLGIQVIPNFNNDRQIMSGYMDAAANQLNLNWVKLQVRWEFAEPEPGVYDWERLGYDLFFETAAEKNLKVLISVVTAPDWAREPGANLEEQGPPADNQLFANFIGTMILRYPGQIHAVEVWNEMNLAREWTSPRGLSAADYVQMVTVVTETIRILDPNIIVVSGALSPTGVDDGVIAISDFRYTDELIAAGVLDIVDCYGAHHNGYNIGPNVPWDQVPNDPDAIFRGPFDNPHPSWSFYSTLTTYANKIRATGSTVPLCVTEFGWAVAVDLLPPELHPLQNFEFSEDNTIEEQRIFLVDAINLMQEWDFVWLAFIWNLNFGPEANWDISRPDRDNIPYSLIRPNYIPAEAWLYISDMNFRGRATTQ